MIGHMTCLNPSSSQYDPVRLKEKLGVQVKELSLDAFLRFKAGVEEADVVSAIAQDRERYEVAPELDESTHRSQECNPALARQDRKIRLVKKEFWAPGIQPYAGMLFTLEPGPVTLTSLCVGPGKDL